MELVIPDNTNSALVELSGGVSCQWIENGRILHFRLASVNRANVDSWAEAYDELLTRWDKSQPLYIMQEILSPGMPLTPYVRQKSQNISLKHSDVHGKTAVVLRRSVFVPLIRTFVERELQRANYGVTRRFFTARDEAIKWLLESETK